MPRVMRQKVVSPIHKMVREIFKSLVEGAGQKKDNEKDLAFGFNLQLGHRRDQVLKFVWDLPLEEKAIVPGRKILDKEIP